jgi:hypothetical protein
LMEMVYECAEDIGGDGERCRCHLLYIRGVLISLRSDMAKTSEAGFREHDLRHILLVGQKKPHKYSYAQLREEYRKPEVVESLKLIAIGNINHIIEFILADTRSLEAFVEDSPVNSDYFPVVEFDADKVRASTLSDITLQQWLMVLSNTDRADYRARLSLDGLDETERIEVLAELAVSQKANDFLFHSILSQMPEKKLGYLEAGLRIDPDNPDLLQYKEELLDIFRQQRSIR